MPRPHISIALVAAVAVLGVALSAAFNTSMRVTTSRPRRPSTLVGVIHDMEAERRHLESRLTRARERLRFLEREAAEQAGVSRTFEQELEDARRAVGLTDVGGDGVVVTLSDSEDPLASEDPNDLVIHDFDIKSVVNALWQGGARAVSVNGERLVYSTAVRCAGNTVLVNSKRLGNPYVIRAVGDPERLESALRADPNVAMLLDTYRSEYGLGVSVERGKVKVEAYEGAVRPVYARPVESERGGS